jgi:hypothetical protein
VQKFDVGALGISLFGGIFRLYQLVSGDREYLFKKWGKMVEG